MADGLAPAGPANVVSSIWLVAAADISSCCVCRRTTEFRRLCDIMRNHLANLIKYRDQVGAWLS